MRRIVLTLVVLFLSACGGDDGGGTPTYKGECVYISTRHSYYSADECGVQGQALSCESAELVDRSDVDRTVIACVFEGCSDDFDCKLFSDL